MSGIFVNGAVDAFHQHLDTAGNIINASDGGIITAEGRYHWYGQALGDRSFAEGGQMTLTGVVMYASDDLVNWEYEGVVLPVSQDHDSPLYAPMRFERPKIIYNDRTGKYVLWCHYVRYPGKHGFEKGQGEALCAVSDRVTGPYTLCYIGRPIDDRGYVRDSTVYRDDDGRAYFIYDRQVSKGFNPVLKPFERCLHIVELSADYTSFTDNYARIDACDQREAPCVVKRDGWYYMITSGLTGWNYNPAKYFRSKALMGEWEAMGDPFSGDSEQTSFRTQGSFIFTTREGRDIYMCERHNTDNFLHCSYIWFPIEYNNGGLRLEYRERFEL